MSLPEVNFSHGPRVRFDPHTGNEDSITLDQEALGENLQRDFPEITSDDWDRVTMLYRDMGACHIGGLTANMELVRSSLSLRVMTKAGNLIQNIISKYPLVSMRKLEKMSEGAEILVQINTKSEIDTVNNIHYSADQPVDLATITSHELKHAADGLLFNKANAHQAKKFNKFTRSTARHMGAFVTGLAASAVGFSEYLLRISERSNDGVLLDKPFLIMMAGVAIAAAPIVVSSKYNTLSYKRFGIEKVELPYAGGEDAANAYSVATRANWENIVFEKSQESLTQGVS